MISVITIWISVMVIFLNQCSPYKVSKRSGNAILHNRVRGAPNKRKLFFGIFLPNLFTHPPIPGFLGDLGERKMKFGSKKAIFTVICFFLRDLDLVWKSATPPTHIWEKSPKKNIFFFGGAPLSIAMNHYCNDVQTEHI